MAGVLYIVPTPVGNLEDMTFRAVRVLKEADLILAEDTRTSSVLLHHYDIHGKLQSHHKYNEHQTVGMVKERILAGQNVALISDAGTPGISDPGFLLARACAEEGIEVQTLPGATACIPAVVSSGLPCDRFCGSFSGRENILLAFLGLLLVLVGNLLPKVRPNKYIGIRLPWIMNDEARWAKTHRFGGFAMVFCGVAMLVCSIFASVPAYTHGALLLVTVGVIVVYSWVAKG